LAAHVRLQCGTCGLYPRRLLVSPNSRGDPAADEAGRRRMRKVNFYPAIVNACPVCTGGSECTVRQSSSRSSLANLRFCSGHPLAAVVLPVETGIVDPSIWKNRSRSDGCLRVFRSSANLPRFRGRALQLRQTPVRSSATVATARVGVCRSRSRPQTVLQLPGTVAMRKRWAHVRYAPVQSQHCCPLAQLWVGLFVVLVHGGSERRAGGGPEQRKQP
jgi:hypothetical protein